jgi:choline dehydrogenase
MRERPARTVQAWPPAQYPGRLPVPDHPIIGSCLWEPYEGIPARANAAEANAFVRSRPDLDTPDLHLWHIEAPYVSEVTMKYAVESAWSINTGLVRPHSRGHLGQDRLSVVDAKLRVYGVSNPRVADGSRNSQGLSLRHAMSR